MNKEQRRKRAPLEGGIKDLLLIFVLGILLLVAISFVFTKENEKDTTTSMPSEKEQKLSNLLQEIEGVGKASVIICETEEGVQSVVVVCEGANDLQVVMDVREAVSAALGAKQSAIKVYVKKE